MRLHIPPSLSRVLYQIGEISGNCAYLVGGSVRDILLKQQTVDIDIVVEGDAIQVARKLQKLWNGTLDVHTQFGTATVTPNDTTLPKVDLVTARRETYQKPATLPKVEQGTITDDLHRRDFSINAMAMHLDPNAFGKVFDPTGGHDDLKKGVIRVLHKCSYVDDPTRIFRAFRYAMRYNFTIVEGDIIQLKDALPYIKQLSGERIRNEIERILIEDSATFIIDQLQQLSVFQTILQGWNVPQSIIRDHETANKAIKWASENITDENFRPNLVRWISLFGLNDKGRMPIYQIQALCFRLVLEHQLRRIGMRNQVQRQDTNIENNIRIVFEKLGIPISTQISVEYFNGKWCIVDVENELTHIYEDGTLYQIHTQITAYQQFLSILGLLSESTTPSKIYQTLKAFPIEVLVIGYSDTNLLDVQRKWIGEYLNTLRHIDPLVTGNDLIQWGETPGRAFNKILENLFTLQLDDKINSKLDAFDRYKVLKRQIT